MGQMPDDSIIPAPRPSGSRQDGFSLRPVTGSSDSIPNRLMNGVKDWPQYAPNMPGITPTGGPMIPMAQRPPVAGTDYAAQQMNMYGDTNSAGTMAGVKPRRKGR